LHCEEENNLQTYLYFVRNMTISANVHELTGWIHRLRFGEFMSFICQPTLLNASIEAYTARWFWGLWRRGPWWTYPTTTLHGITTQWNCICTLLNDFTHRFMFLTAMTTPQPLGDCWTESSLALVDRVTLQLAIRPSIG